jgi:hypothetical protein
MSPNGRRKFLSLFEEETRSGLLNGMTGEEITAIWEAAKDDEDSAREFLGWLGAVNKIAALYDAEDEGSRRLIVKLLGDGVYAGFTILSQLIGPKLAYGRLNGRNRRALFVQTRDILPAESRLGILKALAHEELADLFGRLDADEKIEFAAMIHGVNPMFYEETVLPYLTGRG